MEYTGKTIDLLDESVGLCYHKSRIRMEAFGMCNITLQAAYYYFSFIGFSDKAYCRM